MCTFASGTAPGLQLKKQEMVRSEIWNAALDLFHLSGFDEVTTEQIAKRAGVSRRTFFRYFTSKEDVLASAVKNCGAALAHSISQSHLSLAPIEAAKQSIIERLEPYLPATKRVVQIAKTSASARSAQLQQSPVVIQQLAFAFAHRDGREQVLGLEDAILAHMTMSATSLCVEIWVEQDLRAISDIADEVFRKICSVCSPAPGHS